jgi:hypothetical protein
LYGLAVITPSERSQIRGEAKVGRITVTVIAAVVCEVVAILACVRARPLWSAIYVLGKLLLVEWYVMDLDWVVLRVQHLFGLEIKCDVGRIFQSQEVAVAKDPEIFFRICFCPVRLRRLFKKLLI